VAELIKIEENGIHLVMEVSDDKDVRLLHFSSMPFLGIQNETDKRKKKFRLVEVHVTGENQNDHHGSKHTGSMPGNRLQFVQLLDTQEEPGRRIVVELYDDVIRLHVKTFFQFYNGIPVTKVWTEVVNDGVESIGLEYVSSFALTGIDKEGISSREEKIRLHIPHNTWYGEAQWKCYSLPQLGLDTVNEFSMKRLAYSSTGTWSSSQYAPMGMIENTETGTSLIWQIEHNGSWHWEISDMTELLYLHLSGPTEAENHWWKQLSPGESFVSIPAAVGVVQGGFEPAVHALTEYRRRIRRPNEDNRTLPVIFNDYMNCLFGEPTTEKLLPLIDAASEAGCEYFCVDCGWYSDGYWWDGVGEWLPSSARFPNGITEVLDYIRKKGMVPGLWLELEVMGVQCRLASMLPDNWFFTRHGKRVIDHSRYQLDFSNPEVQLYADQIMKRLVEEYGVGYIKMDYNINAGIGTDGGYDSAGDGLLSHNRAYLSWLDRVFERYPSLVIENCGSGGMRIDYALLSRHSIQSSSDQTDYRKNAVIAAASASLVTPEQCAVWSYPLREGDREEVIFNMVNSMLLRIHQSGHLAEISGERLGLVQEGIAYYKSVRHHFPTALPFWPLGMPQFDSPWVAFGLAATGIAFLAVWRMEGPVVQAVPLPQWIGRDLRVRRAYPLISQDEYQWNASSGVLTVSLPDRYTARLYEIVLE
jgi:alpha-galactosidase